MVVTAAATSGAAVSAIVGFLRDRRAGLMSVEHADALPPEIRMQLEQVDAHTSLGDLEALIRTARAEQPKELRTRNGDVHSE